MVKASCVVGGHREVEHNGEPSIKKTLKGLKSLCFETGEDNDHLFLHCKMTSELW